MQNQIENERLTDDLALIISEIKKYIDIKYDLVKLDLIEKIALISSLLFTLLIMLIVFPSVFLFTSLGIAYYLGSLLGATYWGFLILGGFFFIIGIIIFLLRNRLITKPVLRSLLRVIFKFDEDIDKKTTKKNKKKNNK